ncbi:MAG TPA: hypothetical protein VIC85_14205 [Ktedonobacterales bacterium]|jgi:hypothetical protein
MARRLFALAFVAASLLGFLAAPAAPRTTTLTSTHASSVAFLKPPCDGAPVPCP